ncbi:MAG: hypothetical protein AAF570_20690, partial [Bacteroidota bacterium]
ASRGWLQNFLKRNEIQGSVRMHGKAADISRGEHAAAMLKIRTVMEEFKPENIYNEDESVLLYRKMPSRTYLMQEECRADIRGTSAMRKKGYFCPPLLFDYSPSFCSGSPMGQSLYRVLKRLQYGHEYAVQW